MQRYYGDYPRIITKNSRTRRSSGNNFLPFLTIVTIIASLVALLWAFTSTGNDDNKITVAEKTWHFVIVHERNEIVDAELAAVDVRERGGGGYILNDGSYKIAASVYGTNAAAIAVSNGIDGSTVLSVRIPKTQLSSVGAADDDNIIRKAINLYEVVYEKILTLVEIFEKGEIVESKLLFSVEETYASVKIVADEMKSLCAEYPEAELFSLSTFVDDMAQTVHGAIIDEEHTPSSRLRYALCKIVCERYALSRSLA